MSSRRAGCHCGTEDLPKAGRRPAERGSRRRARPSSPSVRRLRGRRVSSPNDIGARRRGQRLTRRMSVAGQNGHRRGAPPVVSVREPGLARSGPVVPRAPRLPLGKRESRTGSGREDGHPGGRARHEAGRGDGGPAEADGRDRRPADPVAHHEALRALRLQRLRDRARLQGRVHQALHGRLRLARRRNLTVDLGDGHGRGPRADGELEDWRVELVDTGRHTRPADASSASRRTSATRRSC